MIEPLNAAREEFPKSEKCSEGMKILEKKYDNYLFTIIREAGKNVTEGYEGIHYKNLLDKFKNFILRIQ